MDNTDIPTVDQLADFRDAVAGGEDALAAPKYWDEVLDPTVAQYFRITSKTHADEYERVLGTFMLTLDPSAFTIHSVDRVQNLSLWKTYAVTTGVHGIYFTHRIDSLQAKRAATCSREDDPEKARRRFVRAWLFHGCSSDLAPKILQQGFNRSFCGKHNTLYGKGVYFARDASYSTYPLYCTPDAKDIQTVFLVRVVVGEYCNGYKHAVTPDVRNAAKNQLYDSTVDNPRDPSIFVTYHDAQAYPEYCIKFTQKKSSVPNEHPAANKPAHRLYRRNLVLDVD